MRMHRADCGTAVYSLAILLALAGPASTQEVTGELGSPSATTTIDGRQLPAPPPKFGGVIEETAKDSKAWWPPRIVPPTGAPNVLLIMTDDQGYGVPGTFGGVIRGRTSLHSIRLRCPLLSDARLADHWPQPPLGGFWRDHRGVDGISGL